MLLVLAALLVHAPSVSADLLRGSRASMLEQNRVARQHDYTYLRTPSDVRRFVAAGYLVPVRPTIDIELANVSFPYARPEVKTFLERLGAQYRAACGERLVVTSLTRPQTRQPRNASKISVHPTGMAIDLRRPRRSRCRSWLERVLVSLERRDVLNATRERWPPHYHVALFPEPYVQYVAGMTGETPSETEETVVAALDGDGGSYRVRRGDSLWTIAQRHGVGVRDLRAANGLSRSSIKPGQELRIPGRSGGSEEAESETVQVATEDDGTLIASFEVDGVSYRVRRGDSLWTISRNHGVSVGELRTANDLARSRLQPGQTLLIPAAATSIVASDDGGTALETIAYRVRRGDSLWSIARSHGVSVRVLRAANDLSRSRIHPGQVLRIPTSETFASR